MSRLSPLLADAQTGRPFLPAGLDANALRGAPAPKRGRRTDETAAWWSTTDDLNNLPSQRWGVIAPEGLTGDRMMGAISSLIRLREAEQGAKVMGFRLGPGMTSAEAAQWKDNVLYAIPEAERPRYLLLLGDLHELSIELQHALAASTLCGRLAFTRPDGSPDLAAFESYSNKVVALAGRRAEGAPDLCLYTAHDGSAATEIGYKHLVLPCRNEAVRLVERKTLALGAVRELSSADEFLRAAHESGPKVVLSVAHGRGVRSPAARRAEQGALQLSDTLRISAEEVASKPFFPGGVWFCLACFGAGTPAESAYYPWLLRLAEQDPETSDVSCVLECLPGPDERPFIAAMPQAALANPEGPLAVIGHVDLAWCYSFSGGENLAQSRMRRFMGLLTVLAEGGRSGGALDALMQHYRETSGSLSEMYYQAAAAAAKGNPDPTDPWKLANTWMLRNDLRGYILLGDPAAMITLTEPNKAPPEQARTVSPSLSDEIATAGKSPAAEAVKAVLEGEEAPKVIAARYGISLKELWSALASHFRSEEA